MKLIRYAVLLTAFVACLVRSAPLVKSSASTCAACNLLIGPLLQAASAEESEEETIWRLVTNICVALEMESEVVCRGMLGSFNGTFIYVFKQMANHPRELCSVLLADCDPDADPNNANWQIQVPGDKPPVKGFGAPPAVGKPTLRVLHISDLHIDGDYTVGMEAKCPELLCCRPTNEVPEMKAANTTIAEPAGKWGTVGKCDAPSWLVENMLQNIADTHKDLDYIVLTGDLENHAEWTYTKQGHIDKVRNVTAMIKKYLPGLRTFFAIGNHESVPIDNFGPHFAPEELRMDFLYQVMAEEFADWIGANNTEMLKYNGCYSVSVVPGLRLLSINTGYSDSLNFFLLINQTDPDGTLTWLAAQLLDAEKTGDKVQIIFHIPGFSPEAYEAWMVNYYNIVNRFEDTIVGQFMGHTHYESFELFFENSTSSESRPTEIGYVGPSVTPNYAYYPAYRIYTIDGAYQGSSFEVLDFEEYFLDLAQANAAPETAPKWQQLYASAKTTYGLGSMAPAEWNGLVARMKKDDALFNVFYRNRFRRSDMPPCTGGCRNSILCDLKRARHDRELCR